MVLGGKLTIKVLIGGYSGGLEEQRQSVLEDSLRGRVFVVEQRLIERVDAGT